MTIAPSSPRLLPGPLQSPPPCHRYLSRFAAWLLESRPQASEDQTGAGRSHNVSPRNRLFRLTSYPAFALMHSRKTSKFRSICPSTLPPTGTVFAFHIERSQTSHVVDNRLSLGRMWKTSYWNTRKGESESLAVNKPWKPGAQASATEEQRQSGDTEKAEDLDSEWS